MIKEAIIKLSKKQDLTYDEAEAVMNEIMDGAATHRYRWHPTLPHFP